MKHQQKNLRGIFCVTVALDTSFVVSIRSEITLLISTALNFA